MSFCLGPELSVLTSTIVGSFQSAKALFSCTPPDEPSTMVVYPASALLKAWFPCFARNPSNRCDPKRKYSVHGVTVRFWSPVAVDFQDDLIRPSLMRVDKPDPQMCLQVAGQPAQHQPEGSPCLQEWLPRLAESRRYGGHRAADAFEQKIFRRSPYSWMALPSSSCTPSTKI